MPVRNGFWTGLFTGALLGATLVVVLSPEARSRLAEMTSDMDMGPVGRRIGRAAQRVVQSTGIDQAMEELS